MIGKYQIKFWGTLGFTMLLSACGGQSKKPQTLGDIDKPLPNVQAKKSSVAEKNPEDVKRAYYDYIAGARKDDRFRLAAATRIAELELSLKNAEAEDQAFDKKVRETIRLLEGALRDFPNAENNDHSLYQLAKAYDQIGESDKAVRVLQHLVKKYPKSPYFVEAKFRIAEYAFVRGDYVTSEKAYTDVIRRDKKQFFYEKAFFKRGWSRYKQEMYEEALADFYQATLFHKFEPYENLERTERELFDEYFRAIGLTFTYLGGIDAIYAYHKKQGNPIYVYRTYETVAKLFIKQERYTDAVAVYNGYIKYYPTGDHVVDAGINILKIWKDAGFFSRYIAAFDDFYKRFNPNAALWKNQNLPGRETQVRLADEALRKNLLLLAGYYHNQFVKTNRADQFDNANKWYERYLSHFTDYARQDKVHELYAQLLEKRGYIEKALTYYETAAFDGNIVLDKDSAYASVYLTDRLYKRAKRPQEIANYREKLLNYAELYAQYYPDDKNTPQVVLNAVQVSIKNSRLNEAVALANLLPVNVGPEIEKEVNLLKGQAYFDLGYYADAEVLYQDLMQQPGLTASERQQLTDKLALALYKQGEETRDANQLNAATTFFLRVYHELPSSELASNSLYDAIALLLKSERWNDAIDYLNAFKKEYPSSPLQQDITKKLSFAYLKSNRSLEAAREFEKLSNFVSNQEEKMAAQWQAAELYYQKEDYTSALRAFKEYAQTYKRPFAQYMESMHNISDIYQRMGDRSKKVYWLNQILDADAKAAVSSRTERTTYISANAAFSLAYLKRDQFEAIALRIPLAQSLKKKKQAMQATVKLYGRAASYGHEDFVTQSTLSIAEIYQHFAKALMDSERPKNLNADELEQYNILIEDQVFPFEDKAIEFYEVNVKRIAGGGIDGAIRDSLERLKALYPARYDRAPKVEAFVDLEGGK